jgi:zinc transport system substrate-binding protein
MQRILILILILFLIPFNLFSFGEKEMVKEKTKPLIAVSILPQQFVVDKIGNSLVESIVLVGPGQNPHSYEPTPKQMAQLSEADVWFLSKVDFEVALEPKIISLYPNLRLVDTTEGVTFRYLEDHHHDDGSSHHDNILELDRHTWLGKEPMQLLAQKVATTLSAIDPTNKAAYDKNLDLYLKEIEETFTTLHQQLNHLKGETIFVYHPSFGYLFDEFNLTQEAVEIGGKEPTAKALTFLIEKAQKEAVKALFVQAQFPTSAANNIAKAIGAKVIALDPLAYDWLENLKIIGESLKEVK